MAQSRANQTLRKVRIAAVNMRETALRKGIWPEGKKQHKKLALLFEKSQAYDAAGNVFRLPSASRKHYVWKVRNALDARRFHMTGATQRAAHAPQSFITNKNGFTISWPRANFKATIPGKSAQPGKRARKKRSIFLNRYFKYINKRGRGRLGKLGVKQFKEVSDAGALAITSMLKKSLRNAMRVKGGIATIKLELGKIGLEKF